MVRVSRLFIACLAATTVTCTRGSAPVAPTPPVVPPATAHGSLAFVGVSVVSMSATTILRDQTVLVRDGRVAAVGPSGSTAVPADAHVIPTAPGTYVMPGLTDFHVHTFDQGELWLFLANGVTTIRNLHGTRQHLRWRDSIDAGLLDGPRLLTSGPILDGSPPSRSTNVVVTSSAAAEAALRSQVADGYDYIKIYDNVSLEVYRAIASAARESGIAVIGHLPTPVGLDGLFATSGQREVEHLEELLPFFDDGRSAALLDSVARGFARGSIAICPTITVYASARDQAFNLAALMARPEMAYVNPATKETWGWDATARGRSGVAGARDRFERTTTFMTKTLLPRLHADPAIRIVAGTDAPIPMIVPGFSLVDELELYVSAGLTAFQAIATATINPAPLLPRRLASLTGFGTVTVGAPADLQVLSANPLDDVRNLRSRQGVVAQGRWYSQAFLQQQLDSLARRYRAASPP